MAEAASGVVIVMGASRGIGAAIARRAAAAGYGVALNYSSDASGTLEWLAASAPPAGVPKPSKPM